MNKICFKAKVIKGAELGRKLGFPTANLDPQIFDSSFKKGVYYAKVSCEAIDDGNKNYPALLFFGPKTVSKKIEITLEVHILDFDENIYDKEISICMIDFIRPEMSFASLDDLKIQISKDVRVARELDLEKVTH